MYFESLVALLRSYDASLDATSLKEVYNDEKARSLVEWVEHHLAPDTLLSVDELEQYTALEKSGAAAQLAGGELSSVLALSDHEIKEAIQELNRSTEAIAKQTETINQQKEALVRLVRGSGKEVDARADLESRRSQKQEETQKELAWAVEELSQTLHLRAAELDQPGDGDGNSLHATVDSLLRSDDKLLASLQKLGWELDKEDPEEQEHLRRLREICAMLIKYKVEGIRTKLDRQYFESLESAKRMSPRLRAEPDDASVIQEELESLYAEILPVAQMSVEQQYLEPALESVSTKNSRTVGRSRIAVSYIQECLDYLLHNLDIVSSRVGAYQSHQAAVCAVVATAKVELAVEIAPALKREQPPAFGASPVRRRKSSGGNASGVSPARPRANSRPRRRSSGIGADEDPLEELARTLALTLPSQEQPASGAVTQSISLGCTLEDRKLKAADVALNVQQSFESATAAQMADARGALQLVRDSVLAETPYRKVELMDPEIESSIAVLAQQLEDVRASLENRSADMVKARGRSVKKEDLVNRWGR
ncbi:hypothetical protein GQ53DRAFT_711627 [Thozetella sp. PMI_491]|nr:hypothetical protein GQ53DRAFT_711627 [Thozetella sp. PMI_491]